MLISRICGQTWRIVINLVLRMAVFEEQKKVVSRGRWCVQHDITLPITATTSSSDCFRLDLITFRPILIRITQIWAQFSVYQVFFFFGSPGLQDRSLCQLITRILPALELTLFFECFFFLSFLIDNIFWSRREFTTENGQASVLRLAPDNYSLLVKPSVGRDGKSSMSKQSLNMSKQTGK